MAVNDVVWKNGTAGYFASSGSSPTVYWLNGTAYIQHEQVDGGTEYNGSGSPSIHLYIVGSGGYLVIGGGSANLSFGVSGAGTYRITTSPSSAGIAIGVGGNGTYVQPPEYNGDGEATIQVVVNGSGTYTGPVHGGGEVNIAFGVSGTGSYSIHGSGTTEILLNVNGSGSVVQPVKGVGDMKIIIRLNGSGTYDGVLSILVISPSIAYCRTGGSVQFTAVGYDSVGNIVDEGTLVWSIISGTGGTIDADTGLFTAGETAEDGTVVGAASGLITDTAVVNVIISTVNNKNQSLSLGIGIGL
jgi:hypothetical protein